MSVPSNGPEMTRSCGETMLSVGSHGDAWDESARSQSVTGYNRVY